MTSPDQAMRALGDDIPIPTFEQPAFTSPPPLSEARVAIVTTAAMMRPGDEPWEHGQTSFRVFDRAERNLIVSHISPNFDRSGVSADLNVVYPIDRLEEMADESVIGDVSPRHVSFHGAVMLGGIAGTGNQLRTVILDTGPAAAKLLREEGVDVVVLTPV